MLCKVWYNGNLVNVLAVSQDLEYFLVVDFNGNFHKVKTSVCIYDYSNNTKHKVKD